MAQVNKDFSVNKGLNVVGSSVTLQDGSGTSTVINPIVGTYTLTLPNLTSGATDSIVSRNSTDALTNKTINGLTVTTSSGTLTIAAGKTLTNNANITLGGTDGSAISLAGNLTTSGVNPVTLTTTGSTNVTLPTTGTLVNTAVATLSSLTSVGTLASLVASASLNLTGTTTPLQFNAAPGTSGDVVKSGGVGVTPSWVAQSTLNVGSATNLNAGVANNIPYQTSAGVTSFITVGASSVLVTNGSNVPSWSTTLPAISITTSATVPTVYGSAAASGSLTLTSTSSVTKGSITITDSSITLGNTASTVTTVTIGAATANNILNINANTGTGTATINSNVTTGNISYFSTVSTGTHTFGGTGGIVVPSGLTATRATATTGLLRFSTTLGYFEGYNGSAWTTLGNMTLPSTTSNSGKFLTNDGGANLSWGSALFTLGSTAISIGGTNTAITGLTSVTSAAFSGPLTGAVTGNADTATKLQTARAINSVNFDGSSAITITANTNAAITWSTGITSSVGTTFNGSTATSISVAYGSATGTACQGNDARLSDSRVANDVSAWAKASVKPSYALSELTALSVSSDITAARFLDSSNTAYYCDPAGTSNFNTTNSVSFNASGNIFAPIYYDSNNTGYYLDAASTSNLNAITSVTCTASTSMSAPIYYDSNNTGYYFDGSGTSNLNGMNIVSLTAGTVYSTGNIYAYYSDERLKTKQGNIVGALDKVLSLNGFYYINNEVAGKYGYTSQEQQVGLSAQEVEAILPQIVYPAPFDIDMTGENKSKSGENYKTIDYAKLVPLLVEAIKEQQKQIDELKALCDPNSVVIKVA
jgi:hypothetical protein